MAAGAQAMEALVLANATRLERARIKRELRARRMGLGEALRSAAMARMTVLDLLMAVPRFGRFRALAILGREGIGENRLVRELTPRQCAVLVEAVPSAG